MNGPLLVSFAADWIGTFAIHSTCVLALALLVCRLLGKRAIALQEHVLRSSLWSALLSSSLQVFVIGGPWSSNFALPRAVPPIADVVLEADPELLVASVGTSSELAAPPSFAATVPWAMVVVAAAIVFAIGGLLWLSTVYRRLRNVLAARSPELDVRVLRTAAEVAREAGLRQTPHLSRCAAIATPIAFGWMRPEICLPARASELGDASLRAMIAHEIAHLRRADPASMWIAATLQAVFPWQLLLHVARRRWARLVELRCDAIAAGHSSTTAVARCLLDVAEWLRPDARHPDMALAMAAKPSSLRERVEAALHPERSGSPRRLLAASWSTASLVALTFGGPGLQSDVPRPVADVAARSDERASLAELATLLEAERQDLLQEVEQLRREQAGSWMDDDVRSLHAVLQTRLSNLERSSARLRARLARSPSEAR